MNNIIENNEILKKSYEEQLRVKEESNESITIIRLDDNGEKNEETNKKKIKINKKTAGITLGVILGVIGGVLTFKYLKK